MGSPYGVMGSEDADTLIVSRLQLSFWFSPSTPYFDEALYGFGSG